MQTKQATHAATLTTQELTVEINAISKTVQRYYERYKRSGSPTTKRSMQALDSYRHTLRREAKKRIKATKSLASMIDAML